MLPLPVSKKRKGSIAKETCACDTAPFFASCDQLAHLLCEGALNLIGDVRRKGVVARSGSPDFRGQAGVVAAYRLLNREMRESMDDQIGPRIANFVAKTADFFKAVRRVPAWHRAINSSGHWGLGGALATDAEKEAQKAIKDSEHAAQKCLEKVANECFGNPTLTAELTSEIKSFARNGNGLWQYGSRPRHDESGDTTNDPRFVMKASVVTFMCMLTQRCQAHGPIGRKRCRSLAVAGSNNFTVWYDETTNTATLLYARRRCITQCCIKPEARFLQCGDSHDSTIVARSMFRECGVFHPFEREDVCKATTMWGNQQSTRIRRNSDRDALPYDAWPQLLFLYQHPCMPDSNSSLQGQLGLSDSVADACRLEAMRKIKQKEGREKAIRDRAMVELVEDLDAHLARKQELPFSSLAELGESCPGMAATLRLAIVRGHRTAQHCMDIELVQHALRTIQTFLVDVALMDRAVHDRPYNENESLASAQAYDFWSGMHVGLYDRIEPGWHRPYADLRGWRIVDPTKIELMRSNSQWSVERAKNQHWDRSSNTEARAFKLKRGVCVGMRFFDALEPCSLLVYASRPNDTMVDSWIVSTEHPKISITIPAKLYNSYEGYAKLQADLETLVRNTGVSVKLPTLFPRLAFTDVAASVVASAKHCKEIKDWHMQMFRLLVKSHDTRCAVFDVLNIQAVELLGKVIDSGFVAT